MPILKSTPFTFRSSKFLLGECFVHCGAKPFLLTITADPDSQPLDCFHNARKKVTQGGGRIVYGWAIWMWPRVYIEAEHHAVFEPADGAPWIDPTPPHISDITARLFIEDPTAHL